MPSIEKIRALNDAFRTSLSGGRLMLTRGIVGRDDVEAILHAVQTFDAFNNDNDPRGERDFAGLEVAKDTIFWKIDYYSRDMLSGSENPADPSITTRVMTVMLAEEY